MRRMLTWAVTLCALVALARPPLAHAGSLAYVANRYSEALSVVDLAFQKKCFDWINNFRRTGTLLFVSHSPSELSQLCESALWIDNGRVREAGDVAQVARAYKRATFLEKDNMQRFSAV